MSTFSNQCAAPGFVICPRKPWPFGNECHTIACATSGISFATELVGGKDEPSEHPKKEFSTSGETAGLFLCLTKSLRGTKKFCVSKALIELKKKVAFAAAPTHFGDKNVGDSDASESSCKGTPFGVHLLEEHGHASSSMSMCRMTEGCGKRAHVWSCLWS